MSVSRLFVTCSFIAFYFIPSLAKAEDCSDVLIPQLDAKLSQSEASLAWLNIVSQQNYETAKRKGSVYFPDLFSADYSSFNNRRQAVFTESRYNTSYSDSIEVFKQYLTESQISGWVQCKVGQTDLALHYKNVSSDSATIMLTWKPAPAVGALQNVALELKGGSISEPSPLQQNGIYGDVAVILRRTPANEEVRGVVTGKAGVNQQDYSADFYIPAFVPVPADASRPPERLIVPNDGRMSTMHSMWAGRRQGADFSCLDTPVGYDRIDVETRRDTGPERVRRGCVEKLPANNCNSHNEYCDITWIVRGCFVNQSWHSYYKAEMRRLGIPYSKAAVCEAAPSAN